MLSARLFLVRHGQSTYNAQARLQGQADPPLSDAGRAEAKLLKPALPRFDETQVVTSDLQRARETAELLGYPDARPDARFREIDVGEWAGRPLSEFPSGAETAWRGGSLKAPDGESWERPAGAGRRCARRADRRRRDVARGLPRRRRARRALARHGRRCPARRGTRQRQRHGRSRAGPAAARDLRVGAASVRALTGGEKHRKFSLRAVVGASNAASASWGLLLGAAQRWEPVGRHMGPPSRPVTPSTLRDRSAFDALQSRGVDPRARPRRRLGGERRRGVAQELLDRGDHGRGLLGGGARPVQLQAGTAIHGAEPSAVALPSGPCLDGPWRLRV